MGKQFDIYSLSQAILRQGLGWGLYEIWATDYMVYMLMTRKVYTDEEMAVFHVCLECNIALVQEK